MLQVSASESLLLGDQYYKTDVRTARLWYQQALEDKEYRIQALLKLINLDIRTGFYREARKIIEDLENLENYKLYQLIGHLESSENNYIKALEYFSKSLNEESLQVASLQSVASMYTQLGEYEIARKIYETFNNDYGLLGQMELDVITEDYKHGLSLISKFDINHKNFSILKSYFEFYYIIFMSKLDKMSEINRDLISNNSYNYNRLMNEDEEYLINHISRHKKFNTKVDSIINSDINIKELISKCNKLIRALNPKYSNGASKYMIHLNDVVGKILNEETSDICVVTTLDMEKILTLYPVKLSNEFDIEGMQTSKELHMKRELRRVL